jgi:hypothetical protein
MLDSGPPLDMSSGGSHYVYGRRFHDEKDIDLFANQIFSKRCKPLHVDIREADVQSESVPSMKPSAFRPALKAVTNKPMRALFACRLARDTGLAIMTRAGLRIHCKFVSPG